MEEMTYYTGSLDRCPVCGCRDLDGYDDVDFLGGPDGSDRVVVSYVCPRCHRHFAETYELVAVDVEDEG